MALDSALQNINIIYLAGGCFWGVQAYFDRVQGVVESEVGYANSIVPNPSYELVCSGYTNAAEALRLVFNAEILTLHEIFARFFSIVDPTLLNKQGNDEGTQYRSGIYAQENAVLDNARDFIMRYIAPKYVADICTEVCLLQNFYPAESYHQKYLDKNPHGYCHIDIMGASRPIHFKE